MVKYKQIANIIQVFLYYIYLVIKYSTKSYNLVQEPVDTKTMGQPKEIMLQT